MAEQLGNRGEKQAREPPANSPGWILKHLRGQRGWTQTQLARRFQEEGAWYRGAPSQISSLVSMISKWEGDIIVPDPYNLDMLTMALGVSIEALEIPVDPHYVRPSRRETPLPID